MTLLKELKCLFPLNKVSDKKIIDILGRDDIDQVLDNLDSDMVLALITHFVDRPEVHRNKNYFEQKHIKVLLSNFIFKLKGRQKDACTNKLSKYPYRTVKALEKIAPSTIRLALFGIALMKPKNETAVRIINQNPTFLHNRFMAVLSNPGKINIKSLTEIVANTTTLKMIALDLGHQQFFELFGMSTIPSFAKESNSCSLVKNKLNMYSATAPLLLERAVKSGELDDLLERAPIDFLRCVPISITAMMMKSSFPMGLIPMAATVALTKGASFLSYLSPEAMASAAKYFTEKFPWRAVELAQAFVDSDQISNALEVRLKQLPVLCTALSGMIAEIAEIDVERAARLSNIIQVSDQTGSRLVCIFARELSSQEIEEAFFKASLSGRQSFMLGAAIAVEDDNLFRRFALYAANNKAGQATPLLRDIITDLFGAGRNHRACIIAEILAETALRGLQEQLEAVHAQLSTHYTQCISNPEIIVAYTSAFISTHRFADKLRPFKDDLLSFPGHLLGSLVITLSHAEDTRSLLFRVRLFIQRNR